MIKILKILNGEELIGDVVYDGNIQRHIVSNPMSILGIRDEGPFGGGMRLRNSMILSSQDNLHIKEDHIISALIPSETMVNYYNAALRYNSIFMQNEVNTQIKNSTIELNESCNIIETEKSMISEQTYFDKAKLN